MSAVLRQPTSDMMIEVDPHQYVNWLSAMQNGLIVKNALSSKRQYLRREMGIENAATDAHDTHLALKESREGAIFGRPTAPVNIFAAPAGPVQNPYRTRTRWLRDQSGALVRDEHGLPMPEPRKVTRRSSVTDPRTAAWRSISGQKVRIAKTWTEGKMKEEHSPQERELGRAIAWYRRVVAEEDLTAALEKANSRRAELAESAANDNEPQQGWELLRQLRRDHRHDDIEVVELYRGLCGLIASNPLQGADYGYDASAEKEYRTLKLNGVEEVDEAASKGWQDNAVPGGEIEYKEVRKRGSDDPNWTIPAKQKVVGKDPTNIKARPFAVKFNENVMIAKIDMRPVLEELRASLGIGLDAFEDAVLAGKTLTEIGEARGYKHRQASSVGKELVYASIGALRVAWQKIKTRQRKEAKQAMRNVQRARERLEAQQYKRAA
ncbi:hypothetical protein FHS76_001312 [Ochrobactrum daejeonense]|uniref:Uncharacterized protein n=1 Tax=Brucella daejeonensis TaxID=659015 RepID=A0A7W9EM91_9HYPH|nr:hypothetical protein [Brucella daejeonensis]MBB5701461.1 hypothetical protein [Brucella daejeonensis]